VKILHLIQFVLISLCSDPNELLISSLSTKLIFSFFDFNMDLSIIDFILFGVDYEIKIKIQRQVLALTLSIKRLIHLR